MNHARPAGDLATAAEQPGKEFTRIFVSPLAEYPTSGINMDGIAVGSAKDMSFPAQACRDLHSEKGYAFTILRMARVLGFC